MNIGRKYLDSLKKKGNVTLRHYHFGKAWKALRNDSIEWCEDG